MLQLVVCFDVEFCRPLMSPGRSDCGGSWSQTLMGFYHVDGEGVLESGLEVAVDSRWEEGKLRT